LGLQDITILVGWVSTYPTANAIFKLQAIYHYVVLRTWTMTKQWWSLLFTLKLGLEMSLQIAVT